jgi:hypothetical protein
MLDSRKRARSSQKRKQQCFLGIALLVVFYVVYSYGAATDGAPAPSTPKAGFKQNDKEHESPLLDSGSEKIALLKQRMEAAEKRITSLEGASTAVVSRSKSAARGSVNSGGSALQDSLQPKLVALYGGEVLMLEDRYFEASDPKAGALKLDVKSHDLMGEQQWSTAMWVRTSSASKQTVLCVSAPSWSSGGRALVFNRKKLAFDMFNIGRRRCFLPAHRPRPCRRRNTRQLRPPSPIFSQAIIKARSKSRTGTGTT